MAPASNQGSRGGLIAAVVVFVILFVIAVIFAIYYNAALRKAEKSLTNVQQQYEDISDLTGPQLETLKRARSDPANKFNMNMKLLDVAVGQRDRLKTAIDGSGQQTAHEVIQKAQAAIKAAIDQAKTAGAVVADQGGLIGTVNALSGAVTAKEQTAQRLQQELDDANKKVQQAEAARQTALAEMQKAIAQAQSTAQTDVKEAVAGRTSLQGTLKQIDADQAKQRQAAVEAVNKKDQQVTALTQQIAQLHKNLDSIRTKLQSMRINTNEPILRQADGQISRVATNGVVYINRGKGDEITPGLTFEVYDKTTGIPQVTGTGNPDSLPEGKASIEVTRAGDATSECRVIRQSPGQTINPGDIIVNLVYDPNTKYNFVVYGQFDLDHNGISTAQDAAVVKRLITQWGARVTDKINANTDFLVIGTEPQIPSFTAEELRDPINRKKLDDANAALNAYLAIEEQAINLHVPVLNQNRFLYLTGYYSQAAK